MHGRTFNARIVGLKATVWDNSAYRGRCGVIESKNGVGKKGEGEVTIKFEDGATYTTAYDLVALGDNSFAATEED